MLLFLGAGRADAVGPPAPESIEGLRRIDLISEHITRLVDLDILLG